MMGRRRHGNPLEKMEMDDLDHVEYVIPSVDDDIDVNRILQLVGDLATIDYRRGGPNDLEEIHTT